METKRWTEKEVEQFCENHFIEDGKEWIYPFVKDNDVFMEMDKEGTLVIKIPEVEELEPASSED